MSEQKADSGAVVPRISLLAASVALKEYLESPACVIPGFDVPDAIWMPFADAVEAEEVLQKLTRTGPSGMSETYPVAVIFQMYDLWLQNLVQAAEPFLVNSIIRLVDPMSLVEDPQEEVFPDRYECTFCGSVANEEELIQHSWNCEGQKLREAIKEAKKWLHSKK